jgi:hypothetical protein
MPGVWEHQSRQLDSLRQLWRGSSILNSNRLDRNNQFFNGQATAEEYCAPVSVTASEDSSLHACTRSSHELSRAE